MSRIAATFQRLTAQGRKALIPFFTAGDPDMSSCVANMHALVAGGADILELGIPFSDPMADGPVIQRSSDRALKSGTSLAQVLEAAARFRREDAGTPVVLMGYANPIERMGLQAFAQACADAGVDGVLVVDYPPEESAALLACLEPRGIDTIFLLSPTSTEARIRRVAETARGYIYYVSLKGVTGASNLDLGEVAEHLARIRRHARIPVGVGFGIRDAATARAVSQLADAVVVGSRVVQEIEAAAANRATASLTTLMQEFRQAMDAPRP